MEHASLDWPAPAASMAAARRFLRDALDDRRVVVASDSDVAGLAAATLLLRALGRLGASTVPVVAARGETLGKDAFRARLGALGPSSLVAVGMSGRGGLPGVPTLVLNERRLPETTPDTLVVTTDGCVPIAPPCLLVWNLLRGLAPMPLDDLSWLALLAVLADRGVGARFREVRPWMKRWGRAPISELITLVAAARRAGSYRGEDAMQVLLSAADPAEIAGGAVDGAARLRACREEVEAETNRCARTKPRLASGIALLRFTSTSNIHQQVAIRWAKRLADHIVIAANDGFVKGRVAFAVRSTLDVNLVDFLRSLPVGPIRGDMGFGHAKATGGTVATDDFARIVTALGFR